MRRALSYDARASATPTTAAAVHAHRPGNRDDDRAREDRPGDERRTSLTVRERLEGRGGQGVHEGRPLRDLLQRNQRRRGDEQRPDREHDGEGTRGSARDPRAQPDREERQRRDEVALGHVPDVLGREQAHLEDEQRDVRERDRDERAQGRVVVPAGEHGEREGGDREHGDRESEDRNVEPVPEDCDNAIAVHAGGLAERCVGAEHGLGRQFPATHDDDPCHEQCDEQGDTGKPGERSQPGPVASGDRVQRDSDEEGGEEDERLEPHRRRSRGPRRKDPVPPGRRLLDRAREREECRGDDGQRQRLGHQEAGVVQRGRGEGDRRGCDRPARRRQPPCPAVRRDGDERRGQRLQQLGPADAVGQVEQSEGRTDEGRGEDAVVRRGQASHLERPRRPERLPDQPVNHLVRRDPRRREPPGRGEPDKRRDDHEARDGERGGTHPPRPRPAALNRLRAGHPADPSHLACATCEEHAALPVTTRR